MPIITIREEGKTDTGFQVTLKFEAGEYQFTMTDPFTPQEEKRLEWYFEEWLVFPMLGTALAEEAVTSVKTYGERLFEQVFQANIKAYSEYDKLRSDLSQVQIEIVNKTPEFHALHWEAMRDPDLPRPLAVDCVMVRKSIKPATVSAYIQPSAVINLLVVIARPDEEQDVGYRTISRPLMELIENTHLRVNVELLRPGTYEALSKHLEEKGAGYYHIVHFDCHGAVINHEQVLKPSKSNRYFYKGRYGRGDLQKFEGVRAFLAFEGETQGKVDLIEASELAALLTGKRIPVCILNACQSGKQVHPLVGQDVHSAIENDYRETSLASRLMTAGMQMVVGMGYSVTVSAAKLMMEQVYTHLFNQKDITEAIRLGRRELFMQKERKAYFNKTIDLEDWLLPVVYSNQKVSLNLREFTPQEKQQYLLDRSQRYRFPQPQYGFVGRDLDILKVEKSLLRHNILLLQGMGGTGKTTLLNYLREWWQTTHFVEQVFYFGYDQKAWTRAQILFDIAKQVYKQFELSHFQAMPPSAQVEGLVTTLRATPYALILDNFESVTGQKLAIKNTLSQPKRQEVKDFIERLVGGKTLVVVGSRSDEEWLQNQTFKTNIYQLQGLDQEARSNLAEKIIQRHVRDDRIPAIRQDQDFHRLMQLLDGYPLAMEVTLANLKKQSPKEILAGLQLGDVKLDTGSGDKTKSILKCVEYSHSNLSPDAQKLLLCLAPFTGFIRRDAIPEYVEEMRKLEPFRNYAFDKFDEAIQEAINWGLLSPIHPEATKREEKDSSLLTIQPVFPYFLTTKLEAFDKATREALDEGFKNYYLRLADSYQELMGSKDAQEKQLGIFFSEKEYENLYQALQICLDNQEDIRIFFCLNEYLTLLNDPQRNLELSESVCQALDKYPHAFSETQLGYQIGFALHRLANNYLDIQQYQLAKQSYQKTQETYQRLSAIEERTKQLWMAKTYHQLGRVAQDLREFEEARRNYQQALLISLEFGDRYGSAKTYHQLGMVAQDLREFEEARRNYQLALLISLEFGDRYGSAKTYHQLGRVAQDLREFEEARRNYQLALLISLEFGDRYGSAKTYHCLGSLAEAQENYGEARANLHKALEIYVEYKDDYWAANAREVLERLPE